MRYYLKELADQPVYIGGHPMRFDFLPTEDPFLIAELGNCIRNSIGGITEISKDQFDEEVKKKEQEKLSGNNSNRQPHRQELTAFQFGNPGAVGGSRFALRQQGLREQTTVQQIQHPMPDPIEVPTAASFALPPTAKMKDLKAMKDKP